MSVLSEEMEMNQLQIVIDDDAGIDLDAIQEANDVVDDDEPLKKTQTMPATKLDLELAIPPQHVEDNTPYEDEEVDTFQSFQEEETIEDPSSDGPKPAELLALTRIEEESVSLQQSGQYAQALECMEKGLVLRQHFFGPQSPEVWEACKTVGEVCNLLAMTYLQQDEFPLVLELLKKAEILTERDPTGRAVTLNNLACYHRRQGNLHASLTSLTHALHIESTLEDVPNRADTHLNMCAVLSQLGRHQAALEQAQSALILLHEELFAEPENRENGLEEKADRVAVLAIAYHNVGVEYEFLKKQTLSMQAYKKGSETAERYLGSEHGIVITLKNSYLTAQATVAGKEKTNTMKQDGLRKKSNKPKMKRGKSSNRIGIQG